MTESESDNLKDEATTTPRELVKCAKFKPGQIIKIADTFFKIKSVNPKTMRLKFLERE